MATKKVIRTQADFTNDSDASLWREELNKYLFIEDWHEIGTTGEPAFENSWINYNSTTDETAAFYKHHEIVYLKGFIKSGTVGTVAAFTLPTEYRPTIRQFFPIASNGAFGICRILSTGEVQITVGSNVWVSLAGIYFRI